MKDLPKMYLTRAGRNGEEEEPALEKWVWTPVAEEVAE